MFVQGNGSEQQLEFSKYVFLSYSFLNIFPKRHVKLWKNMVESIGDRAI